MGTKVLLMAGGQGTRLWPKSRGSIPKQFMSLHPNPSLFQRSYERCLRFVRQEDVFTVIPRQYLNLVRDQAPALPESQIIMEPFQRGTTACLGFALLHLETCNVQPEDTIVVLPTDTFVDNEDALKRDVEQAIQPASSTHSVVTIGVKPTFAATGYGYIRADDEVEGNVRRVTRFVEKPSLSQAKQLIRDSSYYWNAGIFVWKVDTIWRLFAEHLPEVLRNLHLMRRDIHRQDEAALWRRYLQLPTTSFEYSLIENAASVLMVSASFQWTDLGTWSTLIENVISQKSNESVVTFDADGCLVSTEDRLVGLLGVKDIIVVTTKDVVFVCHRDHEFGVKQFVHYLESSGYNRFL